MKRPGDSYVPGHVATEWANKIDKIPGDGRLRVSLTPSKCSADPPIPHGRRHTHVFKLKLAHSDKLSKLSRSLSPYAKQAANVMNDASPQLATARSRADRPRFVGRPGSSTCRARTVGGNRRKANEVIVFIRISFVRARRQRCRLPLRRCWV